MQSRRNRFNLTLALILFAVAGYLFTEPGRREARYKSASLEQLKAWATPQTSDARLLYYLGLRLRDADDLPAAFDTLTRAADLDTSRADAWIAAAETGDRLHGVTAALNILRAYVKAHPENAAVHLALAHLYFREGVPGRARDAAILATQKDPRNGEAWQMVAQTAIRLGEAGRAQEAARKAIALNPGDYRNHLYLGDALALADREGEAREHYQRSAELAPDQAQPWTMLGRTLFRDATIRGDNKGFYAAETVLKKALTLAPNDFLAHYYLGEVQEKTGRLKAALQSFETAGMLRPDDTQALYAMARLQRRLGNTTTAERLTARHRELVAFIDRKDVLLTQINSAKEQTIERKLRLQLAGEMEKQSLFAQAVDQYELLLARDPNDSTVATKRDTLLRRPELLSLTFARTPTEELLNQADLAMTQRNRDAALLAYKQVLEREPNNARALQGAGLALVAIGQKEVAITYLLQAVRLDPKLSRAHFALGDLSAELNLLAVAQRHYATGLKMEPENARAWYRYAVLQRDDPSLKEQTVAAFQKAVDFAPKNALYRMDLADALMVAEKSEEAAQQYAEAFAVAPDAPEVQSRYGAFLVNHHTDPALLTQAEQFLLNAIKADISDDYARYHLALLRLKTDKPAEAVTLLEPLVQKKTRTVEIWGALARAYRALGQLEKAEKTIAVSDRLQRNYIEYQQLSGRLKFQPRDPDLLLKVARLAREFDEGGRAIAHYRAYLDIKPGDSIVAKETAGMEAELRKQGRFIDRQTFRRLVAHSTEASTVGP